MSPDDLWGELPQVEKVRTPLAILREQAGVLGDKTERMLEGETIVQQKTVDSFVANMNIIASALGGYRVHIIRISHGVDFYPVEVVNVLANQGSAASSEGEYMSALMGIFQSEPVRNVITSLLTQMKAVE